MLCGYACGTFHNTTRLARFWWLAMGKLFSSLVCCIHVQVRAEAKQVAAWGGTERWLGFREFSNMLHSPPYSVLLNCDRWQARLVFSSCCRVQHTPPALDRQCPRRGRVSHQHILKWCPGSGTSWAGRCPYTMRVAGL